MEVSLAVDSSALDHSVSCPFPASWLIHCLENLCFCLPSIHLVLEPAFISSLPRYAVSRDPLALDPGIHVYKCQFALDTEKKF